MSVENIGEWLNGRVAVSKTVGCVFESRLPCHKRGKYSQYLPLFASGKPDAPTVAVTVAV